MLALQHHDEPSPVQAMMAPEMNIFKLRLLYISINFLCLFISKKGQTTSRPHNVQHADVDISAPLAAVPPISPVCADTVAAQGSPTLPNSRRPNLHVGEGTFWGNTPTHVPYATTHALQAVLYMARSRSTNS